MTPFAWQSIVEIHHQGRWIPAAEVRAVSHNQMRFSYLDDYVFGEVQVPVSLTLPVGIRPSPVQEGPMGPEPDLRVPSYFYDLVPQGQGRCHLAHALGVADIDEMVLPLLMAGAMTPIGCVRLRSAMAFYEQEQAKLIVPAHPGFALQDMVNHHDTFLDSVSQYSMLAAGTTGVQGVSPKFLLATDAEGRWYPDMLLPDEHAHAHWILKLPRGRTEADRMVLRNEAAYLRGAKHCGIRTHHAPMLLDQKLFVRRFDRELVQQPSGKQQLHRLHQESLASLVGQRGFGAMHTQQALLMAMRKHVSDPATETIEFIKRDVLNLALRNTDNHARNTAVQRTVDGRIQLTPLFDFAPMFLDPEVIPRGCHWMDKAGRIQRNWTEVIESLDMGDAERTGLCAALADFAPTVARLEQIAKDCGVEKAVLDQCLRSIEEQARQLDRLSADGPGQGADEVSWRNRSRGRDPLPIFRINAQGQLSRLGVLTPIRADGYVMHQEDGTVLTSEGIPWWLLDMRPQGFLGRALAGRHASALGLSANVNEWSDSQALRALMQHGHDAVGNLLLGDRARDHFLSQPVGEAVADAEKGAAYAHLAQQVSKGNLPLSLAAGEQPKFTAYAQTPGGPRHVLVKFSLAQSTSVAHENQHTGSNLVAQRWRDLLLAEHHALETLRGAGHSAATSWVQDHQGQRFLEVERFDRVGRLGRRGLISLAALEAEFVGNARAPWPVLVEELARQQVVAQDAVLGTQMLFAFGRLIGNTDMHTGNLSFLTDGGMPYALAPAYDMLPMAFAPVGGDAGGACGVGGALRHELAPADLHPSLSHQVWWHMLAVARQYLERLKNEERFSEGFAPCLAALDRHLSMAGV